jgi:hypothetical protein
MTADYVTVLRAPSAALLLPGQASRSTSTTLPVFVSDLCGESKALSIPFPLTCGSK